MWTRQDVRDIFYSGSYTGHTDEQLIVDICYLLNAGLLFVYENTIASRVDYFTELENITNGIKPTADIAGGGNGHMALKILAQHYLQTEGVNEIVFEREFEGFRPDLMTKNHTILVECGFAEPNKIFCYFKNKHVNRMIIVPYPDQESNNIQAFTFTASDELADFLCFKEKEAVRKAQKFLTPMYTKKGPRNAKAQILSSTSNRRNDSARRRRRKRFENPREIVRVHKRDQRIGAVPHSSLHRGDLPKRWLNNAL